MLASNNRPRRIISVFLLAMLNVSIMASLRSLPIVAEFGLSALAFFFLVGVFFLIPCALISAELATGWPKEGGVYIWVREGLGDRWGFMAIWMQWAHNIAWFPVILSFVAVTIAYTFSPEIVSNKLYVFLVIVGGFWGMTLLNYFGMKMSSWVSTIGVILGTLLPGVFIIALGIAWVSSGNPVQTPLTWDALIPQFSNLNNLIFLSGLFLAFSGLEVSASYANEVKNPTKNYPLAILLGALLTFSIFLAGSLAIAIVIPHSELNLVSGVIETFQTFLNFYQIGWLLSIMAILLVFGAVAELNSWIIGPIRGLHATSVHGNLPPYFQKLNKYCVPTRLLFFQAVLMSISSVVFLFLPQLSSAFWMLTALSAQSYLIMYILLFIAAIRLRYSKPKVPRAYRIPYQQKGIWALGIMGIAASVFTIALCFVPPATLDVGSVTAYHWTLGGGLFVMCIIPLLIHFRRKPHWIETTRIPKE